MHGDSDTDSSIDVQEPRRRNIGLRIRTQADMESMDRALAALDASARGQRDRRWRGYMEDLILDNRVDLFWALFAEEGEERPPSRLERPRNRSSTQRNCVFCTRCRCCKRCPIYPLAGPPHNHSQANCSACQLCITCPRGGNLLAHHRHRSQHLAQDTVGQQPVAPIVSRQVIHNTEQNPSPERPIDTNAQMMNMMEVMDSMGISPGQAHRALRENGGDLAKAMDWLFSSADERNQFGAGGAIAVGGAGADRQSILVANAEPEPAPQRDLEPEALPQPPHGALPGPRMHHTLGRDPSSGAPSCCRSISYLCPILGCVSREKHKVPWTESLTIPKLNSLED